MKIRIVQIAKAYMGDNDVDTEYLDDKGRVWYMTGHYEGERDTNGKREWVSEWKQLELPDDGA